MPDLMAGSHHSIDMVMSDSIDTAPWRFLSRQPRGPPESLNNSARGVNHDAPLGDQREREEEVESAEMKRCSGKRSNDVMA